VHCPGWAGTSPSGWAGILSRVGLVAPALHPDQAGLFPSPPRPERVTRLGRDFHPRRGPLPRLGLRPPAPAGPLPLAPPAGRPLRSARLRRIRRIRPGRDSSPGRHFHHARLGQIRRIRPGRDFSPSGHHLGTVPAGPGQDSPGPGWIIPLKADLVLSGPGFTSSGTYSSSGIDSSVLCQSWDALWLRLAHTPSLCWSWDAP
jgi:hypothetical protein